MSVDKTVREHIEELTNKTEDNYFIIVGDGWNLSVKNPDKAFKTKLKDVLDSKAKYVHKNKVGVIIYV
jgi:hypothetical protein